MSNPMIRSLTVMADGERVNGLCRVSVTGWESLGLEPLPFILRAWNPDDSAHAMLAAAKTITVLRENSLLAAGQAAGVYRRTVPEGMITEVVFSPNLALWEAPVFLSVEAGTSVSETVQRILEASGTGIRLLPCAGPDPVFPRGQAFRGRAAECVNDVLSAVPARAYMTEAGLCAAPAEGLPVSLILTEKDLTDVPVFTGGKMILRTKPAGWPLGKRAKVKWKNESTEGLVTERSIDADNMTGSWQAEIILAIQNSELRIKNSE